MAKARKFHASTKVPLEALPAALRERLAPSAGAGPRRMAARALVPAEPAEMLTTLVFLAADTDSEISHEAQGSIESLPENILDSALAEPLPAAVLEACAARFIDNEQAIRTIALNRATTDETIAFIASIGQGLVLDIVADNQVRLLRHPDIVAALYFNPQTPTATAVRAIETAARGGINLSHIPGYREIAASIMGETRPGQADPPAASDAAPAAEADPLSAEPMAEQAATAEAKAAAAPAAGAGGIDDELFGTLATMGEGEAVTDSLFDQLLRMASESEAQGVGDDDVEIRSSNVLWKLVREMTLPQKVRLALMGNTAARSLLIHDPKKLVSMAVLRSPGLTDREIADFAANKTLSDDIIRAIANKRDWLRNYSTRLSLILNPKCPPAKALSMMGTLRVKDIQRIARDKEVPAYITRQAKNFLETRSRRSRG